MQSAQSRGNRLLLCRLRRCWCSAKSKGGCTCQARCFSSCQQLWATGPGAQELVLVWGTVSDATCFSSCQQLWATNSSGLASLTGCGCATLGLTRQPS